jgi:hypothetical protein
VIWTVLCVWILRGLSLCTQERQHVGQGIEIAAVLDLTGDDVVAGDARDGAAQIGQQEVMNGPFPAAHPGANCFLLDVLRQSCTLLGKLGMEGSR